MQAHSRHFVWTLLFAITPIAAFARSSGPIARVTGAPGDNPLACTACHAGNALNSGPGSVKILLPGAAVYIPGVKQRVTVQVSHPTQRRWGFEFSARLNSNPQSGQAGDFASIDNLTQVICEDNVPRPCSGSLLFVTHTSAGSRNGTLNGVSFQFDWTPPATNAGPITLYVAGNAANGDFNNTGDQIYTSSLELTPAIPTAPTITAAGLVNAATGVAGAISPNSWVTIFGTNLGVTTRSWADTDFVNGGMPLSLDGVSVRMIQFAIPRLVHVGYVSPTQVNFLVPSDFQAAPGTTVLVRNPAGITSEVPITLNASAAQLFTSGGSVLATRANGALLGKTAPAAPGDTIVLYATGLGATTPGLIAGQIPTQPANLTTLPRVTIGGQDATVVSGGIVPGSGGLYQVAVQVPAAAVSGDLPVALVVGTTTSATAPLTVQK
jgi:uncharacterized protein (TIGR03437 family)